jgi:glycosyltransferase involved in cell wall biosynthesis
MTVSPRPKVSIIIPAYNSEQYLRATIESVLAQSYVDYEVIVVDDGSSDGTKALVIGLGGPIRYIYQSNSGPAAARNTGIDAATGELICFLDADDSWTHDKLRVQVEFMERHSNVGLLFSDAEEYDESGVQCPSLLATSRFYSEIARESLVGEAFQKLLEENFIPTSTVMARRACFDATGLFDVALRGPEDRDMWSRIAVHFPIACIPRVMGRKRAVMASVSRDVESTLRSRIHLWNKARTLFPDLAPVRVVNALLAPTYLQLGFVLLHRDRTREARAAAWKSFGVSRDARDWLLASSLVIFSFTGRAFVDSVFRTKRRFFPGRGSSPAL